MSDTVVLIDNMWCDTQCVAIAAFAIENQATRLQYDINYSLATEGEVKIDKQLLDAILKNTLKIKNNEKRAKSLKIYSSLLALYYII